MSDPMVPVGDFEAMSDGTAATLIGTTGTATQTAVDDRVLANGPTIIADSVPELAQLTADLVQSDAGLMKVESAALEDDAVTGLTDSEGRRIIGAQYNEFGRPANLTMRAFADRGMVRATEGTATRSRMTDSAGLSTWVTFAPDGGFLDDTYWYLANRMHWHVGDDEPFVYPGNFVIWLNTKDNAFYRVEN